MVVVCFGRSFLLFSLGPGALTATWTTPPKRLLVRRPFFLGMLEAVTVKARYLSRRVLQPNQKDAEWILLPRRLSAGYYLIRPLRLACAALGRLRRA
jgi:hypothetical protein